MVAGKQEGAVSRKRKLTDDEKQSIRERQRAIEQALNPGFKIIVRVLSETDDDGNPRWTVERKRDIASGP
jgi:RNase P protein component